MKKVFAIVFCLLMLTMVSTAFAAEVKPGDTITMHISITKSDGTGAARISINTNGAPVSFVSATAVSSGGNTVMQPQSLKGRFSIINADGVATGSVGTVVLKVNADAAPGTYTVSPSGSYAADGVSGSVTFTVVAKACDHNYESTVTKKATCDAAGVKTFTCSKCGDSYTEEIAALGHDWNKGTVTTKATCSAEGVKTFTCQNKGCGKTKTEKIAKDPAAHTPDQNAVTVKPTCTTDGSTTGVCKDCGKELDKVVLPATGHKWDEGKITTEATCLVDGEKTVTCTVCGKTDVTAVKAPGHRPGSDLKQQDPTCTKPGFKYFTCTVCGTEVKEDAIPATGVHIYKVTKETPATCTTEGKRVSTCTYGCGEIKTETIKALGHKLGDWAVTTAPTCTENGEQTRVCENGCGKTETKSVEALGHDWGEWVNTKPVEQQRTCKRCGKVETQKVSNLAKYNMTVCSEGIRFRDLENPITKEWYMFTPIDLSVEGQQTFDLIAGNIHRIGKVSVLVQDGKVTVNYKINNRRDIVMHEEFMTILPSLADVTKLDFKQMTNYTYGEPISIEEVLGGDTKVLLLLRNRATYMEGTDGVDIFNGKGKAYNALVESLKTLMD